MSREHSTHGQEARMPARLESLEYRRLQQCAEHRLSAGLRAIASVCAGPIAGHRQLSEIVGDGLHKIGECGIEVVTLCGQLWFRECNRCPVGKRCTRVIPLNEASVSTHADEIGQLEQHVRIEILGVPLVGTSSDEQIPKRRNPPCCKRAIMTGERHDQVVKVPQTVVDGGGTQQREILLNPAEQARHGAVPSGPRSTKRMPLVDDDQSVGVLVAVEVQLWVRSTQRRELLV